MTYSIDMVSTVREALEQRTTKYPLDNMWAYKLPQSTDWIYKTSVEFKNDVEKLGAWFLNNGIKNKKIMIIGENSYSWALLFYAISCSGNVVVPIDFYIDSESIRELIVFNDCDIVFYSRECLDKVNEIIRGISVTAYSMDYALEIAEAGHSDAELEVYRNLTIAADDTAAVFFTSGSTGKRKGVELSHRNIVCNSVWSSRYIYETERCYHIVPFYHSAGIPALFFHFLGCCTYISRGITFMAEEFMQIKPTLICVVPVMLPSFYNLYRLLGTNMHAQLICGAAPNEGEWISKLKTINVDLYFGYGMTECAPGIAMSSSLYDHKDNSMMVFGCCEVRIDEPNSQGIGEILVKGSNVMKGYYKMPEETAEALRDGWLYTGDLGFLDSDGFLTVVGRKKNILVLSNGENIAPEPIESRIMSMNGVAECMLVCDEGILEAEIYAPESDEEEIRKSIKELNRELPPYSRIIKINMLSQPLPKNSLGKIIRNRAD